MGCNSIPIARSINPVDAVGLTGFLSLETTSKCWILDVDGRENQPENSFGQDKIEIGLRRPATYSNFRIFRFV